MSTTPAQPGPLTAPETTPVSTASPAPEAAPAAESEVGAALAAEAGSGETLVPAGGAVDSVLHDPAALLDPSRTDYGKLAEELAPVVLTLAGRVVGVLVILLTAWIVSKWLRKLVRGALSRAKVDETIGRFMGTLSGWAALVLGVVIALGVFGVDTTSFAAVVAALGLALGLGFQGALGNLAAGVLLLIFRPFKVGEFVRIGDQEGEVEEIELYFTRINRLDKRHVMVPNQQVLDNVIVNHTRNGVVRVDVPIGVSYRADPGQTRVALESAVKKVDGRTAEGRHAVVLIGFGDSAVDWEVRVFCAASDVLAVRERVHLAIWDALTREQIDIPFPQRDVHLDLMGGEPLHVRLVTKGE